MDYRIIYNKDILYFGSYYEAVCEKNKLLKEGAKDIKLEEVKKEYDYTEKKQRMVLCIETGETYDNAKIASDKKACNHKTLLRVLGKRPHCKTAGGYHWEYIYV